MKPYIRPRVQGVKKPEWYIGGLEKYISDVNKRCGTDYQIHMEKFDGTGDADEAERIICGQIDKELPVPYLMLRHLNTEKYKDLFWHWFWWSDMKKRSMKHGLMWLLMGKKSV
mgnify:CR=1 FL=1